VDQVVVDHIMVEWAKQPQIQHQTQVPQNMVMLGEIMMLIVLEVVAVVPVKLDPVLMVEEEDNYQQHIEILSQQVSWEHRDQIQEDSMLQVVDKDFMVLLAIPETHALEVVEAVQ
jgi:hypothetical protein|tara:strand:- start:127 stop:471 length:345 start_codon:yes stop_codon:yes gene_type:complete